MKRTDVPACWRQNPEVASAYEEGRVAGEAGMSRDTNRWDSRSREGRAFDEGWRLASAEPGLASNLRRLRDEKGWTQHELGRRAHLSPMTISNYENGKRTPQMGNLLKLQDALGCTMDELTRSA